MSFWVLQTAYRIYKINKQTVPNGSGGGQVVSVLAFYSDDPSLNPAEVYSFYSVNCLKRTKINEKEAGDGQYKKQANVTIGRDKSSIIWQSNKNTIFQLSFDIR